MIKETIMLGLLKATMILIATFNIQNYQDFDQEYLCSMVRYKIDGRDFSGPIYIFEQLGKCDKRSLNFAKTYIAELAQEEKNVTHLHDNKIFQCTRKSKDPNRKRGLYLDLIDSFQNKGGSFDEDNPPYVVFIADPENMCMVIYFIHK